MTHITDRIDAYVDGELDAFELSAVEAHLQVCAACRAEVDGTRTLVSRLRASPRELEPPVDAWPRIAAQIAHPRRSVWPMIATGGALAAAAVALFGVVGVSALVLAHHHAGADTSVAAVALRSGDLPGAATAYEALLAADPTDPAAIEGVSYAAMLGGDYDRADRLLASLGDDPDTLLRRSLVAQRKGDLDAAKRFGEKSGLPLGKFMAAEVDLADSDSASARALIAPMVGSDDDLGRAARDYLAMIDAKDPAQHEHAEITALWALGERHEAAEAAVDVIPEIADAEDRNLWSLVWAGRAVTSGSPAGAEALLDAIDAPPRDQAWRVIATRAMVHAARGEGDDAIAMFDMLDQGGAPAAGVADARATAAALCKDPQLAQAIVGPGTGVAASRALHEAGSPTWASVAPDRGPYAAYAAYAAYAREP